ncbi:MAG: hypothetical protein H6Q97_1000, partial [Nitrospirae bacterium]|nr:hypothetical protein [Nitrospirota bacterium]
HIHIYPKDDISADSREVELMRLDKTIFRI